MITKQEFEDKLKMYVCIDNIEEDLEYKFPVVEYYMKNNINMVIQSPKGIINLNEIPLIRMEDKMLEHKLISQAFMGIQYTLGYKK